MIALLAASLSVGACTSAVSEEEVVSLSVESSGVETTIDLDTDEELLADEAPSDTGNEVESDGAVDNDERAEIDRPGGRGDDEVVDDRVATEKPAQKLDLAKAAIETAGLTSWEVVIEQQMESVSFRATQIVVGDNARSISTIGRTRSETLSVDGQLYELDSGVWFAKPLPSEVAGEDMTLSQFVADVAGWPTEELRRSSTSVVYEVLCDQADPDEVPGSYLCSPTTRTEVTVDLASGMIASIYEDGDIELSPGYFEQGFIQVWIRPLDDRVPLEAPLIVDSSRAACMAAALGVGEFDQAAFGPILDPLTTEENNVLYSSCGFSTFPRGADFRP